MFKPLCAGYDPELWFPLDEDGPGSVKAREVCTGCPLRAACLEAALVGGEDVGIWGGLSARERRALNGPARVA